MKEIDVLKILPHRPPFLFVDRVLYTDAENKSLLCLKNFSVNEPFFQGHFPESPVVPGVLLGEGLAQAAALQYSLENELNLGESFEKERDFHNVFLLSSFRSLKFKHPVRPGDSVFFEVKQQKLKGNFSWYSGLAYLNQDPRSVCCEGELTAFFNRTQLR